jgi:hypothetical protein
LETGRVRKWKLDGEEYGNWTGKKMETGKLKLAEATSSQFPISNFQFPVSSFLNPASIANPVGAAREPPL